MKNIAIPMLILCVSLNAQNPSAKEIIEKVDKNMSAESRIFTSKMVIHNRRNTRTIESRSWSMGEKKSFTEYLSPAREQGTKMLKLDNLLWIFSPSTDRIIQISGHMLRQSVMGSDLSYEDMMEDPHLLNHYTGTVDKEEKSEDRMCWVITLSANTTDVAYQTQKVWIDKERFIPLKKELYAKSGMLLKKMELSDVKQIQGRWYPEKMLFKDVLKEGEGTEFLIEDIEFNVTIPDYIFSKASLKK
ncbi:MAG: outer membrane lipoprotein-sorting protein [Bacteroidia bacterium]|nr:outer membrane lipoprotein-sorting protein [Bacteroidia bacterium]